LDGGGGSDNGFGGRRRRRRRRRHQPFATAGVADAAPDSEPEDSG